MSVGDKAKDVTQKAAGKAEEFIGKTTDDDLSDQGQEDQATGQARDNVGNAARDTTDNQ